MTKPKNETTNISVTGGDATKPSGTYHEIYTREVRENAEFAKEMEVLLEGEEQEDFSVFTNEIIDSHKSHCPSLTFPEWLVVLFEIDLENEDEDEDEDDHDDLGVWLWDIFYDSPLGGELDQSSNKLGTLKPEELEFVRLVAEKIINEEIGSYDEFCSTIGILSLTADECVFSDDPTVEDLWKVVSVEKDGEGYNVYWQFNGGSTTLVSLAQSPDDTLVVTNDIRKFNERLHPKGEDLDAFLVRNSIAKVQEVMENEIEMTM